MITKKRLRALFCYEYFIISHSTYEAISLKGCFDGVKSLYTKLNNQTKPKLPTIGKQQIIVQDQQGNSDMVTLYEELK